MHACIGHRKIRKRRATLSFRCRSSCAEFRTFSISFSFFCSSSTTQTNLFAFLSLSLLCKVNKKRRIQKKKKKFKFLSLSLFKLLFEWNQINLPRFLCSLDRPNRPDRFSEPPEFGLLNRQTEKAQRKSRSSFCLLFYCQSS